MTRFRSTPIASFFALGAHSCIPLGYPQGAFAPNVRRPTAETTFLDRWDGAVPSA